ncbi:hypothetical protein MSG28_012057 [Choristoneura fumiferana]|uniref:Uncharacterized protein n=1 Tax=Choristoneura fumiferana TaxID=7141 RepID=A0ACC0KMT1_CHOFU|nr:hypothetical protein MSG28_012057 [Choristoneura fumiferana]
MFVEKLAEENPELRSLLTTPSHAITVVGPCARSARIATTILLANPAVKQQCLHCCVSAWRMRQPVKLLALEEFHLRPLEWQRIYNTPNDYEAKVVKFRDDVGCADIHITSNEKTKKADESRAILTFWLYCAVESAIAI